MLPIKKILCPVDFSDFALESLNQAKELATFLDAELCVLHVAQSVGSYYNIVPYAGGILWDMADYEKQMREIAERELRELIERQHFGSLKVSPLLLDGDPAEEIVRACETEHIDLIVIGTHGVGGWRHLVFGSVAEKVIRLAHCPVLVTHAKKPAEA